MKRNPPASKSIPPSDILFVARFFRTRTFARWMRKAGLSDESLAVAAKEMLAGSIDADLGGGIVKKRVRLPGRGRRGGARLIVATRRERRWIFLFGYSKSSREDLQPDEYEALRHLGSTLLSMNDHQLSLASAAGEIEEVSIGHPT